MNKMVVVPLLVVLAMLQVERAAAEPTIECDPAVLQAAITQANANGTGDIRLASDCIYSIGTPATASEALPPITGDIAIVGGKNSSIARDPHADADFRVFTVAAEGKLTLRKLSVEGGKTAGLGGGINNAGTLELRAVTLRNNSGGNGGAIATVAGATTTISKSFLILNVTTGVGGGAFINSGTTTMKKSFVANNFAPINGGGVNTQPGGDTTISDTVFQFNTSSGLGGALSNLGTTRVERCTITRNTGSAGGAIATGNDQILIERSVILENTPDNCSPLNTIAGCTD